MRRKTLVSTKQFTIPTVLLKQAIQVGLLEDTKRLIVASRGRTIQRLLNNEVFFLCGFDRNQTDPGQIRPQVRYRAAAPSLRCLALAPDRTGKDADSASAEDDSGSPGLGESGVRGLP